MNDDDVVRIPTMPIEPPTMTAVKDDAVDAVHEVEGIDEADDKQRCKWQAKDRVFANRAEARQPDKERCEDRWPPSRVMAGIS